MSIRHVIIRGRVQGVGYRVWVQETALRFGLEGWVRNRRDGTVEAAFFGSDEVIADMLAACRSGPSGARVESVDAMTSNAETRKSLRPGERFSIIHTV